MSSNVHYREMLKWLRRKDCTIKVPIVIISAGHGEVLHRCNCQPRYCLCPSVHLSNFCLIFSDTRLQAKSNNFKSKLTVQQCECLIFTASNGEHKFIVLICNPFKDSVSSGQNLMEELGGGKTILRRLKAHKRKHAAFELITVCSD